MDCLRNKRDTPEKQMDFLLGQSGGFTPVEHKLFYLSLLCLQNSNKNCANNIFTDHKTVQEESIFQDNIVITGDSKTITENIYTNNVDYDKKNDKQVISSEELTIKHLCGIKNDQSDVTFVDPCGCDLFIPKAKLPSILFQQTYNKWKATLDLNFRFRQMRKKRVIYLQPLEHFPDFVENFSYKIKGEDRQGFFNFLREFLGIFFRGFDVRLLETKLISEYGWKVKQRYHHKTQKEQLLVKDIHSNMKKVIPNDGYCMLGITWTDLYPTEDLNFVLGEASSMDRSAVFCFGRYEPKAYVGEIPPPSIEEITGNLVWRMIKVISHETCHLFSIQHCVFFHCSMNESTSLEEALSQPLFMCPICLKKILKVTQFDILQRYRDLHCFLSDIHGQYPSDHAANAITWLEKCMTFLKEQTVEN